MTTPASDATVDADTSTLRETFGATSVDELSAPIARLEDKWKLVPAFLRARGLVKQHIQSFDHFIEKELKAILAANSEIRSDVRCCLTTAIAIAMLIFLCIQLRAR
jgi:DNA-directed RNA polymerase beta subunit